MNKNIRKAIIAGNWKMNKTRPEAKALLEELKGMVADVKSVEIVACVPFTNLETALAATITPSPICTPDNMVALSPIHTFLPIKTSPLETTLLISGIICKSVLVKSP